ncbi:hypothetical protein GGS23DRAFT_221999 [Durotheca rogersii]|uniref:uncharacterized protein n=1 Tax=Durotheca rogersii TaxID=419775 RepID=UPI0022200925|nr:uncharacterized protein GGS23DRAFT_221999 [Durotheca rogersii]KAI5860705.1 hypothetical protein GGS23DRAFT_221999 [Durotheca rogersii]
MLGAGSPRDRDAASSLSFFSRIYAEEEACFSERGQGTLLNDGDGWMPRGWIRRKGRPHGSICEPLTALVLVFSLLSFCVISLLSLNTPPPRRRHEKLEILGSPFGQARRYSSKSWAYHLHHVFFFVVVCYCCFVCIARRMGGKRRDTLLSAAAII